MLRALSSGQSGLNAQQLKMDVTANNLANINTTGFKKDRSEFSGLVSQEVERYGIPRAPGEKEVKVGSGVRVAYILKDFRSGALVETGRSMDLAVVGEGFFRVTGSGREERYTRDGSFIPDRDGNFVTPSGYVLEGIQVEPGWDRIDISSDGKVKVNQAGEITEAGQIQLYQFPSIAGLKTEGDNVFSYNRAAGEPLQGNPGSEVFGEIKQGFLEASNVDPVDEMASMIEAQRAYGFSSRMVRTTDEMWSLANNLRK